MSDIARKAILAAGRLREENKRAQGDGANSAEAWRNERLDGSDDDVDGCADAEEGDTLNFPKRRLGLSGSAAYAMPSKETRDLEGIAGVLTESDAVPNPGDVEKIELPDWNAHFAGVPKSPMEEASHKAARRGGFRAPPPDAWREESRAEGQELARSWGSRDKSTRIAKSTQSNSGNCTESVMGAWGLIDDKGAW